MPLTLLIRASSHYILEFQGRWFVAILAKFFMLRCKRQQILPGSDIREIRADARC